MSFQQYSMSKSSFLKFEQCEKAFFLHKNHPYLKDKISVDKQLTFNRGHAIGGLAQDLFPDGIDISKSTKNLNEAVILTKELMSKKSKTLYEATFIFDKVLIMVDILKLENGFYNAFEVKSSLKVTETYLKDACLQYYILKNCLENFEDLFLVTMNGDYVLEEKIEPKKLFKKRSIKKEAEKNFNFFSEKIKSAELILEKNIIPDIAIGKHCFRPYTCDFFGTCWKDELKEDSIFNLPLLSKDTLFEWHASGKKTIKAIEKEPPENKKTESIKNSFLSQKPLVIYDEIQKILSKVAFPVAALDMEIWSPAIPVIKGTRPFQQIPFLFCLSNNESKSECFVEHQSDDRKVFSQALIKETKKYNSILVFDKTMEEQCINSLIILFDDMADELIFLKNKLVDLSEIFKNFYYYHPAFKNNFSLKVISQALNLGITFGKIKSGLEAMNYYDQMRISVNEIEKEDLKNELTTYCYNDTGATYQLYDFLKALEER